MNIRNLLQITPALLALAIAPIVHAASVDDAPPVVIKTSPVAGSKDVDAASVREISVTFSKTMLDGSWSWSGAEEGESAKSTGKPRYLADKRTCVLPVKLEPGKCYAFWLNSERFQNFKDGGKRPAVPYLLVFQTKAAK